MILQNIKYERSLALEKEIRKDTNKRSFKETKAALPLAYHHFDQNKLIHKRTINDTWVNRMGIIENDKCLYCKDTSEGIDHIHLHFFKISNYTHLQQDF